MKTVHWFISFEFVSINSSWDGQFLLKETLDKYYLILPEKCDPYKWPAEQVFRSNIMSLENAIRDPCSQIGGLVVLLDMSGLRFAHAKFLSPHLAKRSAEVIQDAFPMRFKAFHILNEPFYFDAVLALIKPFMTDKIRNRVNILTLIESYSILKKLKSFSFSFRFTLMAKISSPCTNTFQKTFCHRSMAATRAHLTTPSGGNKSWMIQTTLFVLKLTVRNRNNGVTRSQFHHQNKRIESCTCTLV